MVAASPTDLQRVLDMITESAARLTNAPSAFIRRVDAEGFVRIHSAVGRAQTVREEIEAGYAARGEVYRGRQVSRDFSGGRAIVDCTTIRIDDLEDEATRAEYPRPPSGSSGCEIGLPCTFHWSAQARRSVS